MTKSWKTSASAILGLVALIATQASAMLDNDPFTNADWAIVVPVAITCFGLLFAKDSKVTGGTIPQ